MSDFLQQVKIAKNHLHSLKIFEYPTKLQTLVEKLPTWFLTKWSTTEQTLQQKKGYDAFPTFAEFVKEVTFRADRMNITQIVRQVAKDQTRNSPGTFPPLGPQPRKRLPGSTNFASKVDGERNRKTILQKKGP